MSNKVIGVEVNYLAEIIESTVRKTVGELLNENKLGPDFKEEVWGRREVAQFLGVSEDKVSAMFKRNQLKGFHDGKSLKFLKSEVLKIFKKK